MQAHHQLLTLRALVSTKDAGVIIGKQGKNVSLLLERAAVKANVSNVIPGVNDRVVTVTGAIEHVAMAYAFIAQTLLDNLRSGASSDPPPAPSPEDDNVTLRLLISHFLMGSVIGRQGIKIKLIQETSACHMTATKDMLPESTERVVELRGTPESIRVAVFEIGKCLMEDWERGVGTVLYNPAVRLNLHSAATPPPPHAHAMSPGPYPSAAPHYPQHHHHTHHPRDMRGSHMPRHAPVGMVHGVPGGPPYGGGGGTDGGMPAGNPSEFTTEQIAVPADMVGCVIGRGGSKIAEIRRSSGARISIAKDTNEETGRRLFTITGTPEANERAIAMLYGQLDAERERRNAAQMVDYDGPGDDVGLDQEPLHPQTTPHHQF